MHYFDVRQLVYEYFRRDENGNVEAIKTALDHIDLQVQTGDFISIVGHNGSGKSTFARHLNALLHPAEGSVIVNGLDTNDSDSTLLIRKQAGMIFQNPDNQIVAGTVMEDVAFGPENLGLSSEEIIARVESSLKKLDMWEYRNSSPNNLSGGQKQRIAIAGILAMNPGAIIFDEPTAMLDPSGRKDVLSTARELNKKYHITIIWITHYMEEVIGSDYVYVMEDGRIILEGSDREIFSQVNFLKDHHLTVPPITLLADRLKKSGLPIPSGILTRTELIDAIKEASHGL